MATPFIEPYDPFEEKINAWSHALGALIAIIASVFLIFKFQALPNMQKFGIWAYCLSLILVFSSSALYHFAKTPEKRHWYKKLDHTAIYYLIAGTYTPFLSIAIPTTKAHILLIILWSIAIIGTLFKLVFIHRFQKVSLIAYLLMGWAAIFMVQDMRTYLTTDALAVLVAGGLAYTLGALFYALKKIKYTHAIWHVFVLLGAALHFVCIYYFVV